MNARHAHNSPETTIASCVMGGAYIVINQLVTHLYPSNKLVSHHSPERCVVYARFTVQDIQ